MVETSALSLTVTEWVRRVRNRRERPIKKLAREFGYSRAAFYRKLSGTSPWTLADIAKAVDLSGGQVSPEACIAAAREAA